MAEQQTNPDPHERYGFRRSALEVKAAIPISRYCADTGIELKPSGIRLVGLCPLHEERTPSFTVYADSTYHCFGCQGHGDVIDLHFRLNNFGEMWEAMVDLSLRYNIELPQRSPKWHRWQKEKNAIRDMASDIRFRVRCRRLFKACILSWPEIQTIEDPAERREEIRKCWEEFQKGLREASR